MATKVNIGDKFGSLEVINLTTGTRSTGTKKYIAVCRCDCGEQVDVERHNLVTGNSTKCNKCAIASRASYRHKHGNSYGFRYDDPLGYKCYCTWSKIKRRCFNEKDKRYSYYGGRGITVCDRWAESYESFLEDMGLPPTKDHQIDRIDNDGDYGPNNCRWATRTENARNKRDNHYITAYGKTQTLSAWEEETGVKRETIAARIKHQNMSPEYAMYKGEYSSAKAISTPKGVFEGISDCHRKLEMPISTIYGRLKSDAFPDWFYIN